MNKVRITGIIAAVLLVFFAGGCGERGDVIEYRADDLAWDTGDSYTERYLLYPEEGTYERYIGGTYRGEKLDGFHWGTLFETGTYEEDSSRGGIWFSSKKGYNFDTGILESLGIGKWERFFGKLSDSSLTIEVVVDDYDVPVRRDTGQLAPIEEFLGYKKKPVVYKLQ